jgi:hypothetical protein
VAPLSADVARIFEPSLKVTVPVGVPRIVLSLLR